MIELLDAQQTTPIVSIKVIGVGGAGGNTVNSITGTSTIECIVANTDAQALGLSKAEHMVHIGVKSTRGLGTGANPELGKRAAEEDLDKIIEVVGFSSIPFKLEEFKSEYNNLKNGWAKSQFNSGTFQLTLNKKVTKEFLEENANKFWYWRDE